MEAHSQHQKQCQSGRQGQRQRQPIAPVERSAGAGPSVVGIGLAAQLRHRFGHVDRELVGRGVLACVQTGATVVAQIGQVMCIGFAKLKAARHGREDSAEALAVAAGIADLHLARHFSLSGSWCGAVGQRARLLAQGFKLLHVSLRA